MYTLSYTTGPKIDCDNEAAARELIAADYPDASYCDDWETSGEGRERLLVWANEDDAEDDNGQRAVAEIIRDRAAIKAEGERIVAAITEAIGDIDSDNCPVERNEADDKGGWINVSFEAEDIQFRCGWWLYTQADGLGATEADEVRKSGYVVVPYQGLRDNDITVPVGLREQLAEGLECDEDDVERELANLWAEHCDNSAAEETWAADLRQKIEDKAADADVEDLLRML